MKSFSIGALIAAAAALGLSIFCTFTLDNALSWTNRVNLIFDPVASFLTSSFLLGTGEDAAVILTAWASVTTAINAVIAVVAATLIYTAARPAIQRLRRT